MNLTDWMLANLPEEVIADNANPKLALRLQDLAAEVWAEGFQAADDRWSGVADDLVMRNPYAENVAPDRCAICGDKATVRDGMVGATLCGSSPCFHAAWDRAFPDGAA